VTQITLISACEKEKTLAKTDKSTCMIDGETDQPPSGVSASSLDWLFPTAWLALGELIG
jgi:hypothetical protein